MFLKAIRLLQRLVGAVLLILGIYLIFGTQEFFGTILIILAFLIFPSIKKEKSSGHHYDRDYLHDTANDNDNYGSSDSGGDSGGGRD
ncbi:hypothetical protein [Neobacillus rhizophilus]|uniref:Uncharacterized protein n=1 Tax=Neobacillus rhizophilus TaxID=2833579 RepID=A0A942U1Z9_9BACI|nr:hypothetical protein [Neobacillus rhizophilus]MBS4213085.1 hypothetical protein [Neobacillus rhizophilus]